mgnify:FL=1
MVAAGLTYINRFRIEFNATSNTVRAGIGEKGKTKTKRIGICSADV